jgi:hypothetical protein
VLPSVAGDGVRAWLLARRGCDWRNAVISVVIDRAIGAGLLVALGFTILLLPSGLTALGGYRDLVLVVYGGLLLTGALGLLLAPKMAPLLARWRYSRWLARLAVDASPCSSRAEGPADPGPRISHPRAYHRRGLVGRTRPGPRVAGVGRRRVVHGDDRRGSRTDIDQRLGARELAVISLLGDHGIAPERALLFSVWFGVVLAAGSLPGAVAWLLFVCAFAAFRGARWMIASSCRQRRLPAPTPLLKR